MPMDFNRIVTQATAELISNGFDLTNPVINDFNGSGKSAAEIMIAAIANAVVAEIQSFATVTTSVTTVVVGTLPAGPVAASGSGAGTGTVA